jgi:hypothetical protein
VTRGEEALAPAYPASAGIRTWVRTAALQRGRQVDLIDAFTLNAATRDLKWNLMTPCDVAEDVPGTLRLTCGRIGGRRDLAVAARFDTQVYQATVERLPLDDGALTSSWGEYLNRIVITPRAAAQQGTWRVTLDRP